MVREGAFPKNWNVARRRLSGPAVILTFVRMTPSNFAWLVRRSLLNTLDDGCFGYAKGAAYSALLSFFPVLTSAATILVQTRAEFVSSTLQDFLSQIVPPGTEDLVVQQFRVMGERPFGLLVAAGVVSLWAASGVIKSLIEGFQAAYRVPRNRGFLRQGWVAMSLVLLSAVPLVCASLLLVFGSTGGARRSQLDEGRSVPESARLGLAVRQPGGALCAGLCHHDRGHVVALLLRALPRQRWRLRVARRHSGHRPLVPRHLGFCLVRAQYRPVQRDVRFDRGRDRPAGLDVSDCADCSDRLRI